ncbi:MAG: Fur family transcriptional regulator [Eubacteriales bacterium]|nr:Fur family transcriptional regulator [Eubacteriales bacterium]
MAASTSYKTKQRDQIMDCLLKNKDRHITADEIIRTLNAEKTEVGKTTVYRYLDKLVSQGIVRRYFIEGGKSACYQFMDQNNGCSRHYHLKCVDCGQLFHLECDYLGEMDSHIRDHHDFHVDHSKTVLYGQCGTCAGKFNVRGAAFRKTGGDNK